MWRIGELAQRTGLTVRALHHYEQMGLLAPDRSVSNHRFYDSNDLQQLFKILALKDLGLSLEEIRSTLEQAPDALGPILAHLLQKNKEEMARLSQLQRNLEQLQPLIAQGVEADVLIDVIGALSRIERHIAQKTTPDPPGEAQWRSLGQALKTCMHTGRPDSEQTQEVIEKIVAALHQFAGGDETVLAALADLRRHAPPQQFYGWDPPLFAFLDSALKVYQKGR